MTRFSANLGFLWTEHSLPDAIRAAKRAGFDAVECHWPYAEDASAVRAALQETELEMLGLNTSRGDVAGGENGLSAVPGREAAAWAAIEEAIAYARATGTGAVHVMAGFAEGDTAERIFVQTLTRAVPLAEEAGVTLLIEPLNAFDAPGYFLRDTALACRIIDAVGSDRVRLMFDCYHVARTEGDVIARLRACYPVIGHIQFAGVPDRGRPDLGDLEYGPVFAELEKLGWDRPLGAEYKPGGPTDDSLGWMQVLGASGT